MDLDQVAGQADQSLDERRGLAVLQVAGRRLKDDDVAAQITGQSGRDLVDENHLTVLEGVLHRGPADRVRLDHEALDDPEDDGGEQHRLDDFDQAAAPAFVHPELHPLQVADHALNGRAEGSLPDTGRDRPRR